MIDIFPLKFKCNHFFTSIFTYFFRFFFVLISLLRNLIKSFGDRDDMLGTEIRRAETKRNKQRSACTGNLSDCVYNIHICFCFVIEFKNFLSLQFLMWHTV